MPAVMGCPGKCWLSVLIFHAQGYDKTNTPHQSGQIRGVACSLEGTTKQLVNIRQTFKMTNVINLLKPTGHVMHLEFKVQQLYALPTLYLCVLYLSENKQRLAPLIS